MEKTNIFREGQQSGSPLVVGLFVTLAIQMTLAICLLPWQYAFLTPSSKTSYNFCDLGYSNEFSSDLPESFCGKQTLIHPARRLKKMNRLGAHEFCDLKLGRNQRTKGYLGCLKICEKRLR